MNDEADTAAVIPVVDLNMACAYYACVFDAVIDASGGADHRTMRIGGVDYRLVHQRGAVVQSGERLAPVEDVDVSMARVATKGGSIVEPARAGDGGAREGRVKDPFGHSWIVARRRRPPS